LLAPTAFLALAGFPYLLLGLPFFGINFLHQQTSIATFMYQYNAELIPFIFIATIFGVKLLIELSAKWKLNNASMAFSILLIFVSLSNTFLGPFTTSSKLNQFSLNEHVAIGHELLELIPQDSSLSADTYLLPHLAHRSSAYMFPRPFNSSFDNKTEKDPVDYVIPDLSQVIPGCSKDEYAGYIVEFLKNEDFSLYKQQDTYVIFKQGGDHRQGLRNLKEFLKTQGDSLDITADQVPIDREYATNP